MRTDLKLIKNYFIILSKKDIYGLTKLFHKNIILNDWEGIYRGRSAVTKKNKIIFSTYKKIRIKIINIIKKNNNFSIQLKIFFNSNPKPIEVIDLITINNNKIKKIEAYKR
jgi:hypothetical protein